VIDNAFAKRFAAEWIAAWNAHDLERILSHYTDDFEMHSPVIVKLMGEKSGLLKGKVNIRAYWTTALAMNPNLRFKLKAVLSGVSSVTICYDGHRGASAEVLHFNSAGKVVQAYAHYGQNNL
jgi:hypothetical protein